MTALSGIGERTCLVIPCYNEQARLDLAAFEAFMTQAPDLSFVFVNDGSRDLTLQILQGFAEKHPSRVRALDVQPNQGKAEAVRRGMQLAMSSDEFAYVGFWDADLATPLDALQLFTPVFQRFPNIDIVFGTRAALLGRQINRKMSRHYLGRVFATGASIVLALPIYDTQCGAKLFRVNETCRSLFAVPFGSRWIFDVELVARYCQTRSGLRGIYEMPVDRWEDVGGSKVRPLDFIRAIGEMLIIYQTYSRPGTRNWALEFVTKTFVRYAMAGAVGTVVYYAVSAGAVYLGGCSPFTGVLLGLPVGALINYVLNYHFVFASDQPHAYTLPRFAVVAAIGVALTAFILKLVTERGGAHYLLAQLIATLAVLAVGFTLNRFWTFGKRSETRAY